VDTPAKAGYTYRVYKTIFENGKEVEKVLVNQSTYRATPAQVRVGIGAPNTVVFGETEVPDETQGTMEEARETSGLDVTLADPIETEPYMEE
jgi:uncharacterized protein YabE (DUF348 family)